MSESPALYQVGEADGDSLRLGECPRCLGSHRLEPVIFTRPPALTINEIPVLAFAMCPKNDEPILLTGPVFRA